MSDAPEDDEAEEFFFPPQFVVRRNSDGIFLDMKDNKYPDVVFTAEGFASIEDAFKRAAEVLAAINESHFTSSST